MGPFKCNNCFRSHHPTLPTCSTSLSTWQTSMHLLLTRNLTKYTLSSMACSDKETSTKDSESKRGTLSYNPGIVGGSCDLGICALAIVVDWNTHSYILCLLGHFCLSPSSSLMSLFYAGLGAFFPKDSPKKKLLIYLCSRNLMYTRVVIPLLMFADIPIILLVSEGHWPAISS